MLFCCFSQQPKTAVYHFLPCLTPHLQLETCSIADITTSDNQISISQHYLPAPDVIFTPIKMKFIEKKPDFIVWHFILDSILHFVAVFCEIFLKSRTQSSSTFFYFVVQHFTLCLLALVDGIITFFGASFALTESIFTNYLILVFLCVLVSIYIFLAFSFSLSFFHVPVFLPMIILGLLKIGHYCIFLRRFKKMLSQRKLFRIALWRFAEKYGVSFEILAEHEGENASNNNFV